MHLGGPDSNSNPTEDRLCARGIFIWVWVVYLYGYGMGSLVSRLNSDPHRKPCVPNPILIIYSSATKRSFASGWQLLDIGSVYMYGYGGS